MNENYIFFEKVLPEILPQHHNEYVVIVNQHIIGYYPNYSKAFRGALSSYNMGEFCIQRVCERNEGMAAFHSPVLM